MNISDWLDEKEAKNLDISLIVLPEDLSYDDEKTVYSTEFEELKLAHY